jgi:flagellar biosynthetic protein FliR
MAGEILSLQMGLNLAPSLTPMTDVEVPGVGQLQSFLGIMIYIGVDGHLMLLKGVADSLQTVPPGFHLALDHGVALGSLMLGTMFTAALQAAAPAMVALVVVDVSVGIVSRAVPQVQAILVLFPLTILVGLVMFGVSLPSVAAVVGGWMSELPARVAEVANAFQPVS